MRILFMHTNFPAQFGSFGQYLMREGWEVTYLTQRKGAKAEGLDTVVYRDREPRPEHRTAHPYLSAAHKSLVTGLSSLEVAQHLQNKRGYKPDIVMAHSGWGPGMFMKDMWPDTTYVGYFEWYYNGEADDIVYLNGPGRPAVECAKERMRNIPITNDLVACDAGITPTKYQARQFPEIFKPKMNVMHDGVDTNFYFPADPGEIVLGGQRFTKNDEIVTYVARGMEPYRGFPEFMEALARVQKARPQLRAIIVGEDRVAYGKKNPSGKTYKEDALSKLDLDHNRIVFTGLLPKEAYRQVLQLSTVHIYFTVPFVLSWSVLEAMSAGCIVLGSNTAPVREVLVHGENGLLTDLRDPMRIADDLDQALATAPQQDAMRKAARRTIVSRYAVRDLYPAKKAFLTSLRS